MPLTCPNGHAMDEGLFDCPACGAYRPSASAAPLTDEEMEHYLWFPELYCRRCEGGYGPLCDACVECECVHLDHGMEPY